MTSISHSNLEQSAEREKSRSALLSSFAKSVPLQCLNAPFREKSSNKLDSFDHIWVDSKHLEEEIEALKWIARRKEMEWDTCRQMIQQKKIDIKVVKKKINMVRTLNELGPQLNVDSDDEDTPYEDDDDSSSDDDDRSMTDDSEELGNRYNVDDDINEMQNKKLKTAVTHTISTKATKPTTVTSTDSFVSQRDRNVNFVMATFENSDFQSKGALCLNCKEKPPLFVCGACKNQSYCSQTCQKLHWPLHEPICKDKNVEMSDPMSVIPKNVMKSVLPLLGKGDSKMDLDETPSSPIIPKEPTKCLGCENVYPKYLCGGCNNGWYCSVSCQRNHWKNHQNECQ